MFEFFDREAPLGVRQGNLPHWFQAGVTYFVTFRTEDSVPQALIAAWHARREDWFRRNGIDVLDWKVQLQLQPELAKEYHKIFTREFMEYLDRGYGACVLKNADMAKIVGDSLRHFDGTRYHLADFVVMPNHVHILVGLLGETGIEDQCYSWKKFTAGKINKALGRKGRFWQEESFDHLVRGPEQFGYFQWYIADNPRKAKLRSGEYLHYSIK